MENTNFIMPKEIVVSGVFVSVFKRKGVGFEGLNEGLKSLLEVIIMTDAESIARL